MYQLRPSRSPMRSLRMPQEQAAADEALHYHDRRFDREAVKILPGEYFATARDVLLVTLLGSCVAACVRDRDFGIGGMNHFMLPEIPSGAGADGESARYGMNAMELLINQLMKKGARRAALEAKVFGGAAVLRGMQSLNIGEKNAAFVREYLAREGIPIVSEDLLDVHPRKVHFFPRSGRVFVQSLPIAQEETVRSAEQLYLSRLRKPEPSGEVELF